MRVLVFGSTGMLGSTVLRHFSASKSFDVYGTTRLSSTSEAMAPRLIPFDAYQPVRSQIPALLAGGSWDYWINCIGIIKPHCKDNDAAGVRNAIRVNSAFPHELSAAARSAGIRLIQIATDCVYSGVKGDYVESDAHDALDVYGKTKSLGEVFDGSALNIRVSIVGPELKGHLSLLDWFLQQPARAELKGFTHHRWNGVTTLRFAQLCEQIILSDTYESLLDQSHVHHYVPADVVNKFELLSIFQEIFRTDYRIVPVGDIGPSVDRTLATTFQGLKEILPPISIASDIAQLRGCVTTSANA